MDRKYLEDLDIGGGAKLSKEAVDAIMGEHDKDVQAVTAERDSLRGQLTAVKGVSRQDNNLPCAE